MVTKYAAVWDGKLLTKFGEVIVGTEAEWAAVESDPILLIEVTVPIVGQIEFEECIEVTLEEEI